MSEYRSKRMPDRMSKSMSQHMPERISEYMPERMSEYMPDKKTGKTYIYICNIHTSRWYVRNYRVCQNNVSGWGSLEESICFFGSPLSPYPKQDRNTVLKPADSQNFCFKCVFFFCGCDRLPKKIGRKGCQWRDESNIPQKLALLSIAKFPSFIMTMMEYLKRTACTN